MILTSKYRSCLQRFFL